MELLLVPLSWMGYLFILAPASAAVPGAILLMFYAKSKRISVLAAGMLWLLYAGYEYLMKLRILCSGECNIRIDLLLIYPLLLLVSLFALISLIGYYRRH